MTALNSQIRYDDKGAHRSVLYLVANVTTGDTVDVKSEFSRVDLAMAAAPSAKGVAITAGAQGTVITFTAPGLANDAVYLLIVGAGAPT